MPSPQVFAKPKLVLDPDGTPIALECHANSLGDTVDQDSDEWETFCDNGTTYGPARRTITGTFYASYGTGGLWALLHPLEGTLVEFHMYPDADSAISVDNPVFYGEVRIPALPFMGRGVQPGKTATIDLELPVTGATFGITTPA